MKADKPNLPPLEEGGAPLGVVFGMSVFALGLLGSQTAQADSSSLDGLVGSTGAWLGPLAILGFVVLNGAAKAAEAALELLRPYHLRAVKDANAKSGARLQKLFDQQERHRAALTLASHGCTLALVLLAFLPAPTVARLTNSGGGYGPTLLWALAIAVPVVLLNVILGELIPRSYTALHPHRVALKLYRFIKVTTALFSIPAEVLARVAGLVTARFGGTAAFDLRTQAEEEIKNLVESAEETGEIESDEKELLHSVFEFTDTVAREVMTPRVDLDAMPITSTVAEVLEVIHRTGHSRIPLYEDTDDQIVGIVHAKDLLLPVVKQIEVNLRTLMRPVFFVPENKDLHELLSEMRSRRTQMAIVQDEFGGTAGVVTIEDIVEELVGDIVDEYDNEEASVVATEGGHVIDGKLHLDDVNDEIGSDLESEEFDTLGGFVFGLFGRQPQLNESIEDSGYRFTVVMTDGRRIQQVKIERGAPVSLAEEA